MVSRTRQSAGRRKDGAPGDGRNQSHPRRSPQGHRAVTDAQLRLVRPPGEEGVGSGRGAIDDPTDPRWVLAVRASEQLEGSLLGPEKRQRLLRLGKTMGLSPFDANLVIAIVQDQARRGILPEQCAAAGASQLAMVNQPEHPGALSRLSQRPAALVSLILMGLILLQVALLSWLI